MRAINTLVLGLVCAASSSKAISENPPPTVEELLAKVTQSLRESSYRGRMTYEHSGRLEVVDIEHEMIDGVEHSVVRYLNGPSRQLVRRGPRKACDTDTESAERSGAVQGLAHSGAAAEISQSYSSKYLGSERVAGKESWVIQMLPRDEHRHSFVLAVDQQSYLPTKTLYVARGGKPLERLHFVSLDASDASVESSLGKNAIQALKSMPEDGVCESRTNEFARSLWQPGWIPPGFVFTSHRFSASDGHIETYTDGLASFSLIAKTVKEISETAVLPGNAVHAEGATIVVMRVISSSSQPVRLSVVGEIPSETAQRILASVERQAP